MQIDSARLPENLLLASMRGDSSGEMKTLVPRTTMQSLESYEGHVAVPRFCFVSKNRQHFRDTTLWDNFLVAVFESLG